MGQPLKVMRKQKISSHYLSSKIERRKAIQKDEFRDQLSLADLYFT